MKKTIVTEELDLYLSYLHECDCGCTNIGDEEEGIVKNTNIIFDDEDDFQKECKECIEEDDEVIEEGPIESFIGKFPKFSGEIRAMRRLHPMNVKNDFEIVDMVKRKYNLF